MRNVPIKQKYRQVANIFQKYRADFEMFSKSFDSIQQDKVKSFSIQVPRKDLSGHETSSNVSHTKMLLQKHLRTNKELAETKRELVETKQKLNVTSDELFATKEELNKELLDTKTKLQDVELKLKASNDKIEEIQKYYLPPKKMEILAKQREHPGHVLASQQHKPIISKMAKYTFQKDDPEINLIFSSTQPLQNYASRIQNLSSQMEVGKIYFHQQNIFFKLSPFRNNHRRFYVYHVTNIKESRSDPHAIFSNDNFVLWDSTFSSHYNLHIQITNFDDKNSELFRVNRKHQQKHHWECFNENIAWNDFKDEKNEVVFYLKKK